MVPIPEGVERSDEEPEMEDYSGIAQSDGGSKNNTPPHFSNPIPNLNPTPTPTPAKVNTAAVNSKAGAGSSATELPQGTGIIDTSRMTLGSGDEEDEIRG
jgi:hypothetical protein